MKVRGNRSGFTLIEMLVAIAIIVLLAGVAVLFLPKASEQTKAARGADQFQQWLLVVKQWALRDQAPRGLRLVRDPINPNLVRDIIYIEQPEDFVVRGLVAGTSQTRRIGIGNYSLIPHGSTPPPFPPAPLLPFRGVPAPLPPPPSYPWAFLDTGSPVTTDFSGASANNYLDWPVQINDHLQIKGGPVHRIIGIFRDDLTKTFTLLQLEGAGYPYALGSPFDPSSVLTEDYRIIRRRRPMRDQATLTFPKDIALDLSLSLGVPVDGTGNIDILFAPNGSLLGAGTASERMVFYIRDATLDGITEGGPSLIGINCRTGFITAYPVNPDPTLGGPYPPMAVPPPHLYHHAKDPRASGM